MEKARSSAVSADIPLDALTGMTEGIRVPVSVGLNQMNLQGIHH
jgi:hypothetical protein